ncbi:MAG: undecaprenyldiphospho-muramoylpentapeptide beta-N-acetylglucosaminyltransferase [Candidatus Electronema sp. V4]|uniref:undecaprenyldiphospho-muramoylpentapeptide beta-N-acetylglucosaminyltransferase n=1 Tax=Candidatus Electronema sp. V4 TaxID=3454756 RepID=UPI00405578F4
MRALITGGGTGGHLFPGIALAAALRRQFPGCEIMFIGTQRQLDRDALAGLDFRKESIACMGLKGMGLTHRLRSIASLPKAVLEAARLIRQFQPALVFGVGGYVTGPVLLAARLLGVPACIHEQNAIPGLANRLTARFVNKVFVSIPGDYPFPLKKTVVSGNPVRAEILAAAEKKQSGQKSGQPFTLLVMGGSLGAHRVNLLMLEAAGLLKEKINMPFRLIHQTGVADAEQVRAGYAAAGVQAAVEPFIRDMASVYAQADLAVARAGATSLAELAVMGLPAILIPYPHAADDHQAANARYYVAGGGAKMFREEGLDAGRLAAAVAELAKDGARRAGMGAAMRQLAVPDAAERILAECMTLLKTSA